MSDVVTIADDAAPAAGSPSIEVVSFNIQVGLSTARHSDYLTKGWRHVTPARSVPAGLALAANALRGYDFVAVQEADAGSLRSARVNQIAYLAEQAGYAYHGHVITRDLAPVARHCLGFLSRWPTRILADHPLPGLIPGRRALHVEVRSPLGPVEIFVVHLALGRAAQRQQIEYVASLTRTDVPSLLMGDFNCDSTVLSQHPALRRAGFEIAHQSLPTFPSWSPSRAIDHIVASSHLTIESVRTLPRTHSDHLALLAQVGARPPTR
jgi:endonuclease/exonuclease/phosphatase family metal-dependent hydrolase